MRNPMTRDIIEMIQNHDLVFAVIEHKLSNRIDLKRGRIVGMEGRKLEFKEKDGEIYMVHISRIYRDDT